MGARLPRGTCECVGSLAESLGGLPTAHQAFIQLDECRASLGVPRNAQPVRKTKIADKLIVVGEKVIKTSQRPMEVLG